MGDAKRNPWLKAVEVTRKGKLVTIECTSPRTAATLYESVIDLMETAHEDLAWETQR